uniref:Uncharacterized protein n=1 Tax=Cannabis sativa TaxID=3483 RepID=A0A803Q9U6_CANSA
MIMVSNSGVAKELEECWADIRLEGKEEDGLVFDEPTKDEFVVDTRWYLVGKLLTGRVLDFQIFQHVMVDLWKSSRDLNNIGYQKKKWGGRPYSQSLIDGFNEVFGDCYLVDFELHGYLFTWETSREMARWVEIRDGLRVVKDFFVNGSFPATLGFAGSISSLLSSFEKALGQKLCLASIWSSQGLVCSGMRRIVGVDDHVDILHHPWLPKNVPYVLTAGFHSSTLLGHHLTLTSTLVDTPTLTGHPSLSNQVVGSLFHVESKDWDVNLIRDIFNNRDANLIMGIPYKGDGAELWSTHATNSYKVNVNAAIFDSKRCYGYGIVTRDDIGALVKVNALFFWELAAKVIEAISVKGALSWVKKIQWQSVDIEIDNSASNFY